MVIQCYSCGKMEVKHDRSIHRVRGLCENCRKRKLEKLQFLSSRHPAFRALTQFYGLRHLTRSRSRSPTGRGI